MANSEKLCRSVVLALADVPQAVSAEVQAMLSPESLSAMLTLSAAWMGAQGVPVVGQVVDGALLVLGVALLAAQTAELTQALWGFANRALEARSRVDLEAAAVHLSRAVALVGVNVVAFILTKKVAGMARPGPPTTRLVPVTEAGHRAGPLLGSAARASASEALPALAAMGTRPEVHAELPASGAHKTPDPKAFAAWIRTLVRRKTSESTQPLRFQLKWAGAEELLVQGGGVEVWADGHRAGDAMILEVKYVDKPDSSPFIQGSRCNDLIRDKIRLKELEQFRRYAAILNDPAIPAVGLELILNDARAVPFFEAIMRELRIPGRIVVFTEGAP